MSIIEIATRNDALIGVVVVHREVLGTKVSPLKAVDGSQVPLFPVVQSAAVQKGTGAIRVPDTHILIVQLYKIILFIRLVFGID